MKNKIGILLLSFIIWSCDEVSKREDVVVVPSAKQETTIVNQAPRFDADSAYQLSLIHI